jgi:hypothetical protein
VFPPWAGRGEDAAALGGVLTIVLALLAAALRLAPGLLSRIVLLDGAGFDLLDRMDFAREVFLVVRARSIAVTGAVTTGRRLFVRAPKAAGSPAGAGDREERLFPEVSPVLLFEDFPRSEELSRPCAPPLEGLPWLEDLP